MIIIRFKKSEMASTVKNPLVLRYNDGRGYSVNKPGDQEGEYVSKEIAEAMLNAMEKFCNRVRAGHVRSTQTYLEFMDIIKQATATP